MRSLMIILWYVVSVCQLVLASPVTPGEEIMPNEREVQQQHAEEEEICLTPGCLDASTELLKNIDFTVDPCVDFYRYTCNNWIKSHEIPESRIAVSPFTDIYDELNNNLHNLMEREPQIGETPIIEKMRNVYQNCMDTDKLESIGHEPLLDVIRKLGGWPVLGESSGWTRERQKTFDWLDLLVKFRQLGLNYNVLIDTAVKPDQHDNTRHIIELDQVHLGFPYREHLIKGLKGPAVTPYYNMMVESAVMLGANRLEAEEQLLVALNFETKLAYHSTPHELRLNMSSIYRKMRLSQMSNIAPNIDWNNYLTGVSEEPLEADEEIAVKDIEFIGKLDKLLVETDSKTLANYMMWRVVLESLPYLSKRWREVDRPYRTITTGQTREAPRWEHCLNSLTGTLGFALSSMYVKNYFDPDSKRQASEIVDYIKREFMANLDRIDWMDDETRREAREKADAMIANIGHPEELLNDTLIEEHYAGLELKRGEYFNNILNIRKFSTDFSFKRLREQNLRTDWRKRTKPTTLDAFYNVRDNSIESPAAILRGDVFDKTRPNYLNFGAIGYIIGHEITHGFDDQGRQFDKDGNQRNWWDAETELRFKQRVQCIVDQYNNYIVPENRHPISGENTKNENIADNGGLKTAFRAYEHWVASNGVEPRLPGLNLSPKQLFFVSTAKMWCSRQRSQLLNTLTLHGPHSPTRFRVIGPMSNLKEFSDAFSCPVGAPMNPAEKCSVW